MPGEEISIGELSRQTGLAPSAIRFYELRGLITARRSSGGQRRYDERAISALKVLTFAQSAGFTLSEIAELHSPLEEGDPLFTEWRDLAERKLAELDEVI